MQTVSLYRYGSSHRYKRDGMRSNKSDRLLRELLNQLESGKLPAGSRLPTHRDFATQRRVSLSVVNRVYSELQRMGWTVAARRNGTVISDRRRASGIATSAPLTSPPKTDVIDLSHNYA